MSLSQHIASRIPHLKDKLKSAAINKKPVVYISECLKASTMYAVALCILLMFLLLKMQKSILLLLPAFIIIFGVMFFFSLKRVDVQISKRAKEIDKEVLFAGRFLLVKLNSGKPLLNSIIDASQSYGVASKYFSEIVQDIEVGTPMEEALTNACNTTPSKKFRKILFQINNALKIGVDVSTALEATLDEIAQEQLIEIQRYGKKLNSVTMFYMLLAIVVPSLGITLFSIIASMVSIKLDMTTFFLILFFLVLVQLMFMSMFKSIRPNLNI